MTKLIDKVLTFKGGIHPPYGKELSNSKAIEVCSLPDTVVIPLHQHTGAPCEPLVEKGQSVQAGKIIGSSDSFISAPIHSSVTGEVKSIEKTTNAMGMKVNSVIINVNQELDQKVKTMPAIKDINPEKIRERAKEAGLVGLGGAAFPTHVKLTPPKDKKIETVIVNGCECEPYLTCDHRQIIEDADELINGTKLLIHAVGASKAYIAVEINKPDAINELLMKVENEGNIFIIRVATKYPQGSEKQLIKALTGKEVPSGGLPADTGALVQNIGTTIALSRAVEKGKPLIERVVTITGEGVKNPKNLRVKIGTTFDKLIEAAGGFSIKEGRVIAGGPMTGFAQHNLEASVIKGTSGLVVIPDDENSIVESGPCIRCGKCFKVCPVYLAPSLLSIYGEQHLWDKSEETNAMDCIECGCCSYECPSKRPIVQLVKIAKLKIRQKNAK